MWLTEKKSIDVLSYAFAYLTSLIICFSLASVFYFLTSALLVQFGPSLYLDYLVRLFDALSSIGGAL